MYKFSVYPQKCKKINTNNRLILTDIPSPDTVSILESCIKNEPNSMNDQLPIVWDRAENFSIYDISGNKWIDFTSSIFVANVGHSNEKVIDSIQKSLNKKLINSYYYPTQERVDFTNLLLSKLPENFDKILFLSTGSESVEVSIKMSINLTKRKKVLSFINGFHGKTMGSNLVGGKFKSQEWIPVNTFVTHIPFPDIESINNSKLSIVEYFENSVSNLNPSEFASVILEPYQGWSAEFLSKEYAKILRNWCDEHGILLIIDEIQSGFGRTGKLFAYEHFDIIPDIITCAKGISSSLPLSVVITRSEIANTDMSYNSTHGSNPVAVNASYASLKFLLDNNLIFESERKGKILKEELEKWQKERPQYIKKINSKGLVAGIFIESPDGNNIDFVDKIIEKAMCLGLMSIRTQSGTLKIGPPLTITDDALIEGIQVLKESLDLCLDTLV
jgi:4-aminobutyrate aminotransferase/(S)-3-amino-2-methylpropionate transaminase